MGHIYGLDIERAIELLDNLLKCPDLQPAKLASLQRILQSDFFSMVREVYEHIYETVDVTGSEKVCILFLVSYVSSIYGRSFSLFLG